MQRQEHTDGVVTKDGGRLDTCTPTCVSSSTVWKDREGPRGLCPARRRLGPAQEAPLGADAGLLLAGASLHLGPGFLGAFAGLHIQLLRGN